MYTYHPQLPITPVIVMGFDAQETPKETVGRALQLYQRASLQGWLGKLVSRVTRRQSSLLDLNNYSTSLRSHGQRYAGIQAIQIDSIRGTQGKGTDFDARFAPLNERTRTRWLKIAIARLQGTPLPLVELIQVRETYFVVDGHHRISVAKALGEQMIDAEVTAWDVSGALPWEKDLSPARLTSQPV